MQKRGVKFAWLAATLAAAAAAGCGGGGANEAAASGKKIVLLYDTGIEPVNKSTWAAAVKSFEADHPEAKVDMRVFKDDDYGQGGGLIAALRSKTPPDVYFEWAWAAVARDAGNGIASDLTAKIDAPLKALIEPRSWQGTDQGGKTYMVPAAFDVANMLFYNKKILAQHGVAPPQTWEEFLEACKKLKAAGVIPVFHGNQMAWPAGNWAAELSVCYLGLDKYRQAGQKPQTVKLTDPGFVQAVTRLKELADAGAFNPDLNTLNDNEGMAKFVAGSGAFTFTGGWSLDVLNEGGGAETFAALPRPKLPGAPEGPLYVLANSTGYMINTRAPHPDLCMDLLRHLMATEVQMIRVRGGLNSTNVECQKRVENPLQKDVLSVLDRSQSWVAAPDISWDRATAERFYEAVKEVVGGAVAPLAALEAAQRDVDAAPR